MHNLYALQNNYNVLQMHLKILTKGWKTMNSEILSYTKFKSNMEKKMQDFNAKERVVYMLRHPIHLKQCGGDNQMLADYLMMECK